ncbi:hypothetical protein ACFL3M_03880 [Patescibacteria group bacterium]
MSERTVVSRDSCFHPADKLTRCHGQEDCHKFNVVCSACLSKVPMSKDERCVLCFGELNPDSDDILVCNGCGNKSGRKLER